jgi:hypothetical protein
LISAAKVIWGIIRSAFFAERVCLRQIMRGLGNEKRTGSSSDECFLFQGWKSVWFC